ncbi:hypothetical protein BGZ65_004833 [Modicella reniformis]|uniref:Uncharacterized protein n=2 Tax=Modicella reniformis TaxID=1440133 RepID=A0A9P6M8R7_9FUNG|nr:hypothetical protein BGZ65_004833 [Modicella reniformis]
MGDQSDRVSVTMFGSPYKKHRASDANNTMLAEFLRQSMRGMKAPTEVYPLLTVVTGASLGGTYMGFRKLVTDPHLRRNATRRQE